MFHRNRVTEKEVLQVACKMMSTADYPEDLRLTGELYNNLLFSLHIYTLSAIKNATQNFMKLK